MTVGVETCPPETPIVELARLILERGIEEVVVLAEGNALGVVGQDELVRACTREDFRSLNAADILHEGVPQVPPDIPLAAAAQIMLDLKVRALFLMHHAGGIEYPAAVISYRHFLRLIGAQESEELNDLGIHAQRRSPLDEFIQRREEARKFNQRVR